MRVSIHIKQLSLQGVPVTSRRRLRASLESELERLVAEQGISRGFSRDARLTRLDGARVVIPDGTDSDARLGRSLARRVHASLASDAEVRSDVAGGMPAPSGSE